MTGEKEHLAEKPRLFKATFRAFCHIKEIIFALFLQEMKQALSAKRQKKAPWC